jgi:hypothetical protein
MSREIDFHSAFTAQFATATLFTSTYATTADELAPSDFPAFSLQLGKTSYHGLDNDGYLHLGSQEFTLRLFYRSPQLELASVLGTRAVYIGMLESFVATSFTTLPFSGLENYRITSTEITGILPPVYDKLLTTHCVTIRGRYHYVFV